MLGANELGSGACASSTKRSMRHAPRPELENSTHFTRSSKTIGWSMTMRWRRLSWRRGSTRPTSSEPRLISSGNSSPA